MKVLLVGASGTIGSGVARLFKNKGFEVIAASRSTTPSLDMNNPESIDRFYAQLGKVDAIICTAGDAAMAGLENLKEEDLQLSLNSKLGGQVNLVSKGIQNLNDNGAFILTAGILAYQPIPKTSLVAMVNAGLEGFVRGAALELKDGKRIVVVHPAWVAETAQKVGMDPRPWPDSDKTATAYWNAWENAASGSCVFVKGYEPR